MKRNMAVRVLAIIIVAIMVMGIGFAAVRSFAAGPMLLPATGGTSAKWPIFVGVGALLLIVVCVLIPKFAGKKK